MVNKIDRQDARPREVVDEIYELFLDLDATAEQIEFPILYSVSRDGLAKKELTEQSSDLRPLFEQIVATIPPPRRLRKDSLQLLVANLDYSEYVGRLAIFGVNNSPFAGREGRFVTSRQLKERLDKELLGNVAIRNRLPGGIHRVVTEALGRRKGQMTKMVNHGMGRVRLEFEAPSRGLIGFRSEFLTETKGTGLLNTLFLRWGEWQGALRSRATGSLVAAWARQPLMPSSTIRSEAHSLCGPAPKSTRE